MKDPLWLPPVDTIMAEGGHEALEHYYAQLENQNRFHCYERKDATACHDLANFIETKKKKLAQALEEYRKNCFDNNFGKSCFSYAQLMYNGKREVKKNIGEAVKAYKKGCDVKRFSGESCDVVGQLLYAEKNIPEVTSIIGSRDVKKAGKMFARGCEDDDKLSCAHAVHVYIEGVEGLSKPDVKLAYKYAVKGCELNSGFCCVMAAKACKEGIGTDENAELFDYYNKRAVALQAVDKLRPAQQTGPK